MNKPQVKKITVASTEQLNEVLKEYDAKLFYSIFDEDGEWIRHIINFYFNLNKKLIIKAAEESEYPDYESAEVMARKYGLKDWQAETQFITKVHSFMDNTTNYHNGYFCKLVDKLIDGLNDYYEFSDEVNFFDFIKNEFKDIALEISNEYYNEAIKLYNENAHPTEYMLSLLKTKKSTTNNSTTDSSTTNSIE